MITGVGRRSWADGGANMWHVNARVKTSVLELPPNSPGP